MPHARKQTATGEERRKSGLQKSQWKLIEDSSKVPCAEERTAASGTFRVINKGVEKSVRKDSKGTTDDLVEEAVSC